MTHIKKPILQVLKGEKLQRPPIWIMRQAGRYLPEYRAIREKSDFLTMCHTPSLACEITLQPIRRYQFDAAILFSDILIPLVPMGLKLHFEESKGPIINNPVRTANDVENIRVASGDSCAFVGDAIRLILKELDDKTALIGFAGAPFTLASYAVEGGSSKNFAHIKKLIYTNPAGFHGLMDKITETTIQYLYMQIDAGVEVVQLFDSWAAALPPAIYKTHALPYTQKVLDAVQHRHIPSILFARGNPALLPYASHTSATCIGVGWESDMHDAALSLGPELCLQGNIDPILLLTKPDVIQAAVKSFMSLMSTVPNPHIFNLGHGILPNTPPENVSALVEAIRSE